MTLPVFAINLDRSEARWSSLSAVASELGADLRRVPGIDGSTIDPKDWIDVDFEGFRARNGRAILPGEYGCYRSHLLALQMFLDDGAEFGLIIEDDVQPRPDTFHRIDSILKAAPDFDAIKLVNHRSSFFITAAQTPAGDEVGRTIHGPQGSAAAYLVSRKGAERLLSQLPIMSFPWDVALERFWDGGTDVFSTSENLLGFSDHRQQSLIASKAQYKAVKSKDGSRISAISFRLWDYARRMHHVLLRPATHNAGTQTSAAPLRILELIASIAILLFVSAVWTESDIYRYAGIGLVLAALIHYFRRDLWSYDKPLIGPIGIMCIVWALYVAARFGYDFSTKPGIGTGAAEGVYLLPIFFATFGYALLLYIRHPFWLAAAFIAISGAVLLIGTDYAAVLANVRPINILHNNSIHASVGIGFIAICTIPFAILTLRREGLSNWMRALLLGMSALTFSLALVNLFALRSKGVWVAIAVALPVLVLLIYFTDKSKTARRIAIMGLIVSVLGACALYQSIWKVGGGTAAAVSSLATEATSGGILPSIDEAVSDDATPNSVKERFELWANATEIWADHPIFGAGISWLKLWEHRKYQNSDYTIMHNGYLEIAVRYGIVGLLFYFTLIAWATVRVWQASKARLIDPSAMQCFVAALVFFLMTILSNSNNRLALGESYIWFAVGIGFYCYYLLQRHGNVRPRTYI